MTSGFSWFRILKGFGFGAVRGLIINVIILFGLCLVTYTKLITNLKTTYSVNVEPLSLSENTKVEQSVAKSLPSMILIAPAISSYKSENFVSECIRAVLVTQSTISASPGVKYPMWNFTFSMQDAS